MAASVLLEFAPSAIRTGQIEAMLLKVFWSTTVPWEECLQSLIHLDPDVKKNH